MAKKRILILGGGFGGSYTALQLDRTLARRPDLEVILIARENYLLFTPMLHEVAAGELSPGDIVNPLRGMLKHVHFVQGDVTRIDLDNRRVHYELGGLRRAHDIGFDHLVLAMGSETNYFGMTGVETHGVTMKSLGDDALLHNRMIALLEEAAAEHDSDMRRRLLTFVVAGGGFAGVETCGAMNDFLRESLRYYPEIDKAMLRLVLIHPGATLLPDRDVFTRGLAFKRFELAVIGIEDFFSTAVFP